MVFLWITKQKRCWICFLETLRDVMAHELIDQFIRDNEMFVVFFFFFLKFGENIRFRYWTHFFASCLKIKRFNTPKQNYHENKKNQQHIACPNIDETHATLEMEKFVKKIAREKKKNLVGLKKNHARKCVFPIALRRRECNTIINVSMIFNNFNTQH